MMNKKIIISLIVALNLSVLGTNLTNGFNVDNTGSPTGIISTYNEHPAQWLD